MVNTGTAASSGLVNAIYDGEAPIARKGAMELEAM